MTRRELVEAHREEILAAVARNRMRNLRIFGSVARGDDDDESDIDFLVTAPAGTSLFDLGGLYMDLVEILGCEVDLVSDRTLEGHASKARVLGEAVPV